MALSGPPPDVAGSLERLNALLDEWVRLTRTALTLSPDDASAISSILDRREQLMPLIGELASVVQGAQTTPDPDGAFQRERQRCLELSGQAADLDSRWAAMMAERLEALGAELSRARTARRLGRACGGREEAAGARFLDQST
ncbi:MAG: hypothetical protein KatS3mg024_2143 [Armatimonadota bacterium]|nr:MAG: hypothetical protein KatS3mg024_2143 [Armatimonadota bacterium]